MLLQCLSGAGTWFVACLGTAHVVCSLSSAGTWFVATTLHVACLNIHMISSEQLYKIIRHLMAFAYVP